MDDAHQYFHFGPRTRTPFAEHYIRIQLDDVSYIPLMKRRLPRRASGRLE